MASLVTTLTAWKNAVAPDNVVSIDLLNGQRLYNVVVSDDGTTGDSIVVIGEKNGQSLVIPKASIAFVPTYVAP